MKNICHSSPKAGFLKQKWKIQRLFDSAIMIHLYTSEDYIGHFEQKAGEALLQRYKLYQT